MNYSLSYKNKHKDKAYEIKIPINQLGLMYEYIKNNRDKRYNIIINKADISLEKIKEQLDYVIAAVGLEAKHYTVECHTISMLTDIKNMGYNAYYAFPATDWETFYNLFSLGVSDILIDGPLGFYCKTLENFISEKTFIRANPVWSTTASLIGKILPQSFFIRPEDVSQYEGAIDILDFKETDELRERTLYEVYERGVFIMNIDELIPTLPKVKNVYIRDEFGKTRPFCKQVCMQPGRQCRICEHCFDIAKNIEKVSEREGR